MVLYYLMNLVGIKLPHRLEYEKLYGPLGIVLTVITFLSGLAVGVRRLHDVNKSGWWLLIMAIPFIGFVTIVMFWLLKGNETRNRYGDPII